MRHKAQGQGLESVGGMVAHVLVLMQESCAVRCKIFQTIVTNCCHAVSGVYTPLTDDQAWGIPTSLVPCLHFRNLHKTSQISLHEHVDKCKSATSRLCLEAYRYQYAISRKQNAPCMPPCNL